MTNITVSPEMFVHLHRADRATGLTPSQVLCGWIPASGSPTGSDSMDSTSCPKCRQVAAGFAHVLTWDSETE